MGRFSTLLLAPCVAAFSISSPASVASPAMQTRAPVAPVMTSGLKSMDMTGKVAFVAGVADSTGYGWAIAKALASAGCTIIVGTWPPVLGIVRRWLRIEASLWSLNMRWAS